MSIIDLHPQRAKIIEGILAGVSCRKLASQIRPMVHHSTLGSFKLKLLQTAVKPLRPQYDTQRSLIDIVSIASGDKQDQAPAQRLAEGLRSEIQGLVRAKLDRRRKWITNAESKVLRDSSGTAVQVSQTDSDGVVTMIDLTEMDHKALAAHDRNETSDLDLLARLGQLYSEAPTGDAGVRALMSFGDVIINVAAGSQVPAGQVVDAIAEEVVDVAALRRR